jgi:S-adenosylmethionine:tRNA ribosyltransferase-isomerase
MKVAEFDFLLPADRIAQRPLADRAASRLLRLQRLTGSWEDRSFRELPALLRSDDLLVFNDSRVIPARLFGRRSGVRAQPLSPRNPAAQGYLQGRVEVLLTRPLGGGRWEALVRPGRKIGVGERLIFGEEELHAEVVARGEHGERTLRFDVASPEVFFAALERLGHVPLPPYIARADTPEDRERYQTVFARELGSAAAPTAGLHFTPEILGQVRARGMETAEVTLHVGLGTFQPLHQETVEENRLHAEPFTIREAAAQQIVRAKAQGRRVVAVGTTTVRTLESAAQQAGGLQAMSGEATIFIYPGFRFQVVDALLTNFHLPRSSLLMLVCAFAGTENVLRAYEHAIQAGYRFYSYGDCMLVE